MRFAGFWLRCSSHLVDLSVFFGTVLLVVAANLAWQGVPFRYIQVFFLRTWDELDYMFGLLVTFWVAVFSGFHALGDYFSQTLRAAPTDAFATLDVYVFDALTGIVLFAVYLAVGAASRWQGAPGKRLMNLRVMDVMGRRLLFNHALVRSLLGLLSFFFAGIPLLWVILSPRKQAMHDYWSGTLVVLTGDPSDGKLYPSWQ